MNASFRLFFVSALFFSLLAPSLTAADFVMTRYDVDVLVRQDGALQVEERIEVDFSEPRRGIFRSLPVSYEVSTLPEGEEQAKRPLDSDTYRIHVRNVEVPGDPFRLMEEKGWVRIRIGDPDVYHEGKKSYTIRYEVWGALNDFGDVVEVAWNLIGHENGTGVHASDFRVRLEENVGLTAGDVVVYGGRKGSRENPTEIRVAGSVVSGSVSRRLQAGEGITMGMRLPRSYFTQTYIDAAEFAKTYVIDRHEIEIRVGEDASLEVREVYEIDFLRESWYFTRSFEDAYYNPSRGSEQYFVIGDEFISSNTGPFRYEIKRYGPGPEITLQAGENPFRGRERFVLEYTVHGAIVPLYKMHSLRFDICRLSPAEPFRNSSWSIVVPEGGSFAERGFRLSSEYHKLDDRDVQFNERRISGRMQWDARQVRSYAVQASFGLDGMSYSSMPPEVYYRDYLIEEYLVDVLVREDGALEVEETYDISVKDPVRWDLFRPAIPKSYKRDHFQSVNGKYGFPNWNLLGNKIRFNTSLLETSESLERVQEKGLYAYRPADAPEGDDRRTYRIRYLVRSNREVSGGAAWYTLVLANRSGEPVRDGLVRWRFERDGEPSLVEARMFSGQASDKLEPETGEGGSVRAALPVTLGEENLRRLQFAVPKSLSGQPSLAAQAELLWNNNLPLWISLLFSAICVFLWYLFGRDKAWRRSVKFRPPEKITPAEAGYLWDEKIHRKDLVSLVYFWASEGLLEIQEVEGEKGKKDFRLWKVGELPEYARNFERVMFDGLFGTSDNVLVSETRDSLYKTMRKTHKELVRFSRVNRFWLPGTKPFGKIMASLGLFAILFSLVWVGIGLARGDLSVAIPLLIAGLFLFIFGKKMPKRTPFGTRVYHHLLSFREFIRTADINKLRELYDEDSDYFNKTIAYAIVMGEGKAWAAKFKGLIDRPPSYVRGHDPSQPWDTIIFTNWVLGGMHRMNRDFNYIQPSGGSTGSWGGSGGSSFGGGFSSGGGFGGGGVSSW